MEPEAKNEIYVCGAYWVPGHWCPDRAAKRAPTWKQDKERQGQAMSEANGVTHPQAGDQGRQDAYTLDRNAPPCDERLIEWNFELSLCFVKFAISHFFSPNLLPIIL